MAYYMTSEQLIASIKRRANIPDSQAMITDEEILDFANEEMMLNLVPLVVSKHEDYYLTSEDVAVQNNVFSYAIPYRALGTKLRELAFYDEEPKRFSPLYRKSIDEITESSNRGTCTGHNRFYIMNENIVLDTTSNVGYDTLRFFYNMRPNSLVLNDRIAAIGLAVDVFAQYTLARIFFLDLPRRGEHLVTARLQRYSAGSGWRKIKADWVCTHLLDVFDPHLS